MKRKSLQHSIFITIGSTPIRFVSYSGFYVIVIAIICIYAIIQIEFECAYWVCYSEQADKYNRVISNLSYSYLAAVIFYLLTVTMPNWKMKFKIKKALDGKINSIRSSYKACVDCVLPMYDNPKDEISKEEVIKNFKAISYKDACRFSLVNSNESILDFINRNHQYIVHLSEELLEYKPWLSAETIAQLEDIRNSRLPGFILMMSKFTFDNPEDELKMRAQLAEYVYNLWDLSKSIKP